MSPTFSIIEKVHYSFFFPLKDAKNEETHDCVLSPIMFSRRSSVESLNSCELHSVHSTVYSEYSCYPTALVSPSDIPDSPNQSVLPSPFANNDKTLQKNDEDDIEEDGAVLNDPQSANVSEEPPTLTVDDVFDQPRIYQNEGSSRGGLSSASSLSALTVDVDTKLKPTTICDMYDLRSCIRSAQPSKPQSVKHIRVSPYATSVAKGVVVKESDPAKSYFLAYDKKDSVGAYEPTDEIVRRYADEGNEVPGIPIEQAVIKTGVVEQSGQSSIVPEEPNPSPPSVQPEVADSRPEMGDVSVADIHSLINMAMPKPKNPKSSNRHVDLAAPSKGGGGGLNGSFGQKKGAHRKEAAVKGGKAVKNDVRVVEGRTTSACCVTPSSGSPTALVTTESPVASSTPRLARSTRSELRECIYSAFPKPQWHRKSKPSEGQGSSANLSKRSGKSFQ
uniref:Uncharacterized protein n=1 Tax=Trichuris muris TaxID=70415 RepID=A0A5S6Q6J1_TRIMR